MSLISDALKKAQRQRDGGLEQPEPVASDASGDQAPRVARREKPAGFRSQMLIAAGGGAAVLVIVLVMGGVWLWRSGQKTEALPVKTEVAATHPGAPAATTPSAPVTAAPALAPPPPVAEFKPVPIPVAEKPKPAPATTVAASTNSVQFTLPLAPPPATTQAAPTAPTPSVLELPKSTERPKPPAHMVTIIENLRVAGIRAAGEDSKVLMNDRVYRLNDIVDHELGMRLTGVTAKSLTFEDEHGAVYTRNF